MKRDSCVLRGKKRFVNHNETKIYCRKWKNDSLKRNFLKFYCDHFIMFLFIEVFSVVFVVMKILSLLL